MHDMSTSISHLLNWEVAVDWTIVLPPDSYAETLIPDMTVFRDGAFGRWLGREVKLSWMELVSLEGETGERGSLSNMWG